MSEYGPLDTDSLPEFLKPRLRLFLSMDLVGSTYFKQIQNKTSPIDTRAGERSSGTVSVDRLAGPGMDPVIPWLDPIIQFYARVEQIFADEWCRYCNEIVPQSGETNTTQFTPPKNHPELWKANGDELIYTLELSCHFDAFAAIFAWLDTFRIYRKELKAKHPGLDLKASAWTAGFPVGNVEVMLLQRQINPTHRHENATNAQVTPITIPSFGQYTLTNYWRLDFWYRQCNRNTQDKQNSTSEQNRLILTRDYIGPSIDVGFRISKLASPRKFAITADLAFILSKPLSHATSTHESGDSTDELTDGPFIERSTSIRIFYDGSVPLKGVLAGKPYPFFWIDALHDDPYHESEDALTGRQKCALNDVETFCKRFFHQNGIIRPFISNGNKLHLSAPSSAYKKKLQSLARLWEDEKCRFDQEESIGQPSSVTNENDGNKTEEHDQNQPIMRQTIKDVIRIIFTDDPPSLS